jgi:uncharacterized protein
MNVPAPLAQLFSLGFVWVFFHCAGMCGPIVGGLQLRGPLGLLLYQSGRIVTLGALGALAGLLGARASVVVEGGGPFVALAASMGTAAYALSRLRRPAVRPLFIQKKSGLTATWSRVVGVMFSLGALRPFALGLLLGFLPCMIVAWALSLAASSASPVMGALVMASLVLMTTPTLGLATAVSRVLSNVLPVRALRHASAALMLVSSAWLMLVALAGFEVIAHQHFTLALLGARVTVMLY